MAGKGGRPPKPPQLRIHDGTHRDDRHGPRAAIGVEKVLTVCPRPTAKKRVVFVKWWKHYCAELITVGVLTARDLAAVETLCDAHQDEADARQALSRAEEQYMPTMSGGLARHPAFITMENARRVVVTMQVNLGFSPVGRNKVPPTAVSDKSKVQGMNRKASS